MHRYDPSEAIKDNPSFRLFVAPRNIPTLLAARWNTYKLEQLRTITPAQKCIIYIIIY